MKLFCIKLTAFLAMVVAMDFGTGKAMDYIVAHTVKGDYGRNNYICTEANQDCLIFGSSRAIHHYDPDSIGAALGMSCYNCGEDGMGIVTMYGRYQLCRQRHIPKVVLYDVVGGFDISPDDKSRYIKWLRYYEDNPIIANLIDTVDATEHYKRLSRSYKYNSRFLDIVSQYISHSPEVAANYKYAPLHGHISPKAAAVDAKAPAKDYPVDSLKLQLFERMIRQCQADGTQFVLLLSPWYKATNDKEYASIIALCERMGVPVLNHLTDSDITTNPDYFEDTSHMNVNGVAVYDRKVCEEVKNANFANPI